jgi:hypothetical protein
MKIEKLQKRNNDKKDSSNTKTEQEFIKRV